MSTASKVLTTSSTLLSTSCSNPRMASFLTNHSTKMPAALPLDLAPTRLSLVWSYYKTRPPRRVRSWARVQTWLDCFNWTAWPRPMASTSIIHTGTLGQHCSASVLLSSSCTTSGVQLERRRRPRPVFPMTWFPTSWISPSLSPIGPRTPPLVQNHIARMARCTLPTMQQLLQVRRQSSPKSSIPPKVRWLESTGQAGSSTSSSIPHPPWVMLLSAAVRCTLQDSSTNHHRASMRAQIRSCQDSSYCSTQRLPKAPWKDQAQTWPAYSRSTMFGTSTARPLPSFGPRGWWASRSLGMGLLRSMPSSSTAQPQLISPIPPLLLRVQTWFPTSPLSTSSSHKDIRRRTV